jgi:hypothetical protein
MRDYEQSVRGYRITGDPPKPDKRFNYDYMQQTPEQVKAHEALKQSVRENGANCVGRADFFSGDTLPTDHEARLACAGCDSFAACEFYKQIAHPAYGVYAGTVVGRGLMEDVEDEFD